MFYSFIMFYSQVEHRTHCEIINILFFLALHSRVVDLIDFNFNT